MKISLFDTTTEVDVAVDNAHRAREAGLVGYWVPQIMNADPVAVLAVVGREVQDIKLGTSVIAMQSTLPQMLAQQSLTLNQISGGRFTLGLGTSHQPVVTGVFGLPWAKPYTHMVEYLDALLPLLTEQSVSTNGTYVSHHTAINVPADPPDVMLAALGPKMLRLAADRTSGTITWMTGPATITDHIRPTIGPDADIVAGVAVWVTDDVESALAEDSSREGKAIEIDRIVVTHAHPDHIGGVDDVRARFGALPVMKKPWPENDRGLPIQAI